MSQDTDITRRHRAATSGWDPVVRARTRRATLRLAMLTSLAVSVAATPNRASDIDVRLTRIDGTTVAGTWHGYSEHDGVEIAGDSGLIAVRVDDLMGAEFGGGEPASLRDSAPGADADAASASTRFFLADDGELAGEFLGGDEESILASTALGSSHRIPFGKLAGLRLAGPQSHPKAEALLQSALDDRLPGQDVIITRDADKPKVMRGRLGKIDVAVGSFTLGGKTRTFQTERIYGVVFASGVVRVEQLPVRITLIDGSSCTARLDRGDEVSVTLATVVLPSVTIPIERIAHVGGRSTRIAYLSDRAPAQTRVEGRVHRPCAVARDVGLMGQALSIGGTRYRKGIACPSRTQLVYDLNEPFSMFVAEIGIDDYVRPRGTVEFRVHGGDKELFASGLVTGRDVARLIRVDLTGVTRLTLIVDYGDELDIADHAVWGDARLLRPPG